MSSLKSWSSAAIAACTLAVAACQSDSSGGPGGGGATTFTTASVETGITTMSAFINVCSNDAGAIAADPASDCDPTVLEQMIALRRDPVLRGPFERFGLTSQRPADEMGSCGGRARYLDDYSHSNGTTTGTFAFENYCSVGDAGEQTTMNGQVTFKNVGTPSASGPITSRVEADSRDGITQTVRNASGQTLASQRIAFEGYRYDAGVPGGDPTASSPDELKSSEVRITNLVTNKTYRQKDYRISTYVLPSGGDRLTISGRGYRSDGSYFDVSTATAITTDDDGDFLGGQLEFKGKDSERAVLTLVPGDVLQGTMTVNGQPVTNVPRCR